MLVQFRNTLPDPKEARRAAPAVVMGATRARRAWEGGEEPSIAEILDDPVMQQMMNRDQVEPAALLGLVAEMRQRLANA